MSCLSRLFGLIFAGIVGIGFLAVSLLLIGRWPELGFPKGPFYSLLSAITGAVCVYLGLAILLTRNRAAEVESPLEIANIPAPVISAPVISAPVISAPVISAPVISAPVISENSGITRAATLEELAPPPVASIFAPPVEVPAESMIAAPQEVDSPQTRILRLARTRPNWRISAPQLAQLANLSLRETDATARALAENGAGVEIGIGEQGETVYVFNTPES